MQLWPPQADPSTLTRQVWDATSASSIPGVAKALMVYQSSLSQCPLDAWRGNQRLPRPLVLQTPDLALRARTTWLSVQVRDWWLHGNAVCQVTARYESGWPANTRYWPAHMWHQAGPEETPDGGVDYYLNGRLVPRHDVIHVQRGSHPTAPWRGVGVVEEHLESLNGIGLQSAAERRNLQGGGVPSVAVIVPQRDTTGPEFDEIGATWDAKFAGPGRRPAFLPNGTQIVPLSWNPHDGQMVEAKQLGLIDVANMFNLDPYWVGHPGSSHTYKSPGPMFLTLLRTALEPVMQVFEQTYGLSMLPYGQEVRFDREQLTRDDFASMMTTLVGATGGQAILTREEARQYANRPPEPELGEFAAPPAQLEPADDAADAGAPKLAVVPDPDEAEETGS